MTARYQVLHGDCLEVLKTMPSNSVDSICCDPPAGIAFMGKSWDTDKGGRDAWIAWLQEVAAECLRVIKPGGHALVWALPRTSHWTGMAWENAGWEPRDKIVHIFGSGFPKSLNVGKAIDKHGGEDVSWFGPWFSAWRERNGVSIKEVAALFPSTQKYAGKEASGNPTGCVSNWEAGRSIPTLEQFNRLRDAFALPFDTIEAVRREVLVERTMVQGGGNALEIRMGERREVQANITAPATDKAKQWEGWGTALKPAAEDWWLMRKPLDGTVAGNVLRHGTGAINIDGCRVGTEGEKFGDLPNRAWANKDGLTYKESGHNHKNGSNAEAVEKLKKIGRFPANIITDGSNEVVAGFPNTGAASDRPRLNTASIGYGGSEVAFETRGHSDNGGSAARFFYCAKANKRDRDEGLDGMPEVAASGLPMRSVEGDRGGVGMDGTSTDRDTKYRNTHPTVKSVNLMRYLVRLITPKNGICLDPFMGSGSTGKGCAYEGFGFIGIELDAHFVEVAEKRILYALANPPSQDEAPKEVTRQLIEEAPVAPKRKRGRPPKHAEQISIFDKNGDKRG